jgi:zinc transporter ZupT
VTAALPLLIGLAAGLSTYAGGRLAMRVGRHRDLIVSLTGGFVVGLALLDLLPQAIERGADHFDAASIAAVLVTGFALYLVLHRLPEAGRLGPMTLILHSLLDGLGIGVAFQFSAATGWLVAAAVLAHDLADGANMVGMHAAGGNARRTHRWLLANAAAPVVGVLLGSVIAIPSDAFALLLALFGGGFLYIGAAELLPRGRAALADWRSAAASIAGLVVMGVVVHLAG